jgi:glycosyltransferase involved in cell wall biosynthesis
LFANRLKIADSATSTLEKFNLKSKAFMLALGGNDPRKNIEKLITAYGLLSESIRSTYPLVLPGGDSRNFGPVSYETDNRVTRLGYVTDEELAALYMHSALFLMPSLDEGFGLPIVESLAAGAIVVANDIPIFRWVGGNQIKYVDCRNPLLIKNEIETCLSNPSVTTKTMDSRFNWNTSANTLLRYLSHHNVADVNEALG